MTPAPALLRREGVTRSGRRWLLRPTGDGDVPALVALHDAVAAEGAHLASRPGDRGVLEEGLALAALRQGGGLAVVVEVEGALCGTLTVHRFQTPYHRHLGEVAIIVTKEQRRQGLGRALMTSAVAWAGAVGITKLTLGVLPGNAAAIALYRSLGFEEEGLRRRQVLMPDGYRDVLAMGLLLERDASPDILPRR